MSLIKTWQRLTKRDPVTHLFRRVQELERHIDVLATELNTAAIFVFPGEPDDTTNWQLIFTGSSCYWKSDDVVGDIATVHFNIPAFAVVNSLATMLHARLVNFLVYYHVENALGQGPKVTLYSRNSANTSDDFDTEIGAIGSEGATTVTTGSAPHSISPASVDHQIDYLNPMSAFMACKINNAQQTNNTDLRILGFMLVLERQGEDVRVAK